MARIDLHDTDLDHAGNRRSFLRHSTTLALAACAAGLSPLGFAASTRPVASAPLPRTAVFRWDAADYLPDLDHVRAGWMPPCASLIGLECPVGLSPQLSPAPVVRSEPARQRRVRLVGYDGISGLSALRLDALFSIGGKPGDVALGWADVRGDRLYSTPSAITTWSSNGVIPLQIEVGKDGTMLPVQIPSQAGVYLALVGQQSASFDAFDLFFREQEGGGFHRRLTDAYGAPMNKLGYFVLVVQNMGR
jgi:hypothetical protein